MSADLDRLPDYRLPLKDGTHATVTDRYMLTRPIDETEAERKKRIKAGREPEMISYCVGRIVR